MYLTVIVANLILFPILMYFVQLSMVSMNVLGMNGYKIPLDGGWVFGASASIALFLVSFSNVAICYFLSMISESMAVAIFARRSVHVSVWAFTLAALVWSLRWL